MSLADCRFSVADVSPTPEQRLVCSAIDVYNSYKQGAATRLSESFGTAQVFRFGTEVDRRKIITARDRAYEAYDNSPIASALVDTETDNVIGDGLNYRPETEDKDWNREAIDRYYEWLESCSVRGADVHTGCEIQRFIWSQSRVAGDFGVILVGRGFDSLLQLVPAENICTPDGQYADKTIYDGIKFDAYGRPVEFHVLSYDEREPRRTFATVGYRDFVYFPQYTKTNQARPPSCFVNTFQNLAHVDRYIDGVSLAAWMGTVMGLIIKENSAPKQLAGLSTLTNSQGDQQKAITLENGMVKFVGNEGEVVQVNAHQPMQQTPDFIRAMMRQIGLPFRMPLEVIAMDMSSCNFASARIGLLPFYRNCRIKAGRFASRWSRIIRWWLSRERNRLDGDPKKWTTPFPDDYWKHSLLVNSWEYTDPVSEAQADLLQVDMGSKSMQMVIEERGRDVQRILREREEWSKETKNLPAVNSTLTRHPQSGVGATGDPLGKEQVEPPKPAEQPKQEPTTDAVKAYARAYRDIMAELDEENTDE